MATCLVQEFVRLDENRLDSVSVSEDLLGLNLAVENPLDESGADVLGETSRYVAVVLRVHFYLLQKQFPNLKQAARRVHPF